MCKSYELQVNNSCIALLRWTKENMTKMLLENSVVIYEISAHSTPQRFLQYEKKKSKDVAKSAIWIYEKSYVISTQVRASSGNSV